MTAAQPAHGQPATMHDAMLFYGFMGVAGTTGIETAMTGHQWADGVTVKLDRSEDQFTHRGFAPLQSR